MWNRITTFIILISLTSPVLSKSYENYKVYQLQGSNYDIEYVLEELKTEIADGNVITDDAPGKLIAVVAPDLAQTFEDIAHDTKLEVELLHNNLENHAARRSKRSTSATGELVWRNFYDYESITAFVKRAVKKNKKITQLINFGKTYEGRDMIGIRITTNCGKTNGVKPAIVVDAGIHAREWTPVAAATYLINQLLTSTNPNVTYLRDTYDWHIIPCLNPDGYTHTFTKDRMWRKTRSKSASGCYGADLNRNWGYHWGTAGSSNDSCHYQIYQGSEANSEIEIKNYQSYLKSVANLTTYLALHSNYKVILVPYGDSKDRVENYDDLVKIGTKGIQNIQLTDEEGTLYAGPGTAADVINSPASGNAIDWVKSELKVPIEFNMEFQGIDFIDPASKIVQRAENLMQFLLGITEESQSLNYVPKATGC